MWPFRRKKEPAAAPAPPGAPPATGKRSAPRDASRRAEDVLRELDHEASGGPGTDPMLGRFLLAAGPLTREYVQEQLAVGGKASTYLGQLLAESRAPREAELFDLLTFGYAIPDVDLKKCKMQVTIARALPRDVALKYKIVPIDRIGDILCVAFAEQPNPKAIEAVRRATGLVVKAFRCPPHHVQILLRRLYAREAAAPAPAAVQASLISQEEYVRVAQEGVSAGEVRWENLHASAGPIRAVRIARR